MWSSLEPISYYKLVTLLKSQRIRSSPVLGTEKGYLYLGFGPSNHVAPIVPPLARTRPFLDGEIYTRWFDLWMDYIHTQSREVERTTKNLHLHGLVLCGIGTGAVLAYLECLVSNSLPDSRHAILLNCPTIFKTNPTLHKPNSVLEVQFGPPKRLQYGFGRHHMTPSDYYQYIVDDPSTLLDWRTLAKAEDNS